MDDNPTQSECENEQNFWRAYHFTLQSLTHVKNIFLRQLNTWKENGGTLQCVQDSVKKLSKQNFQLRLPNRHLQKFKETEIDQWDHEIFSKAIPGIYHCLSEAGLKAEKNYCSGISTLYTNCRCHLAHIPPSLTKKAYKNFKEKFENAMKLLAMTPTTISYLVEQSELQASPKYRHLGQFAFREGKFDRAVEHFISALNKDHDRERPSIVQVLSELISVCFLKLSEIEKDSSVRFYYCRQATRYRRRAEKIRDKNHPISFYIPRGIIRETLLASWIFSSEIKDMFVFTGDNICTKQLMNLAKPATPNTIVFDHEMIDYEHIRFVILQRPEDWERFCCRIECDRNIHLILVDNEDFFIIGTVGCAKNLNKLMNDSNPVFTLVTEVQFIKQLEKMQQFQVSPTMCIVDIPGMGKTFQLLHLREVLQERFPDRMVLFASMPEIVNAIKSIPSNTEASLENNLINLIINRLYKEEEGRVYLKAKIYSGQEVTIIELLLDGFDEVREEDFPLAEECLEILKTNYSKTIRVWLSTRAHPSNKLRYKRYILSFHLYQFQHDDQLLFLTKYWTRKSKNLNRKKLKSFAKHCLHQIEKKLNKSGEDLVGIPIQCYLIAECFESDARRKCVQTKSKIRGGNQPGGNFSINSITSMYEKLIEKKCLKKMGVADDTLVHLYSQSIRNITFQHAHLALKILFPSAVEVQNKCASFVKSWLNNDELLKVGLLLASSTEEVPRFIHLTIAEYLVAWFLLECMKQGVHDHDHDFKHFFLNVVLESKECGLRDLCDKLINPLDTSGSNTRQFKHVTICYFLNCILKIFESEDNIFVQNCPKHPALSHLIQASVNSDFYYIAKLKFVHEAETDLPNELCLPDLKCVGNFLLSAVQFSSLELLKFTIGEFTYSEMNPFYTKSIAYSDLVDNKKITLLHLAVIRGNYQIFRYILDIFFRNLESEFLNSKQSCHMSLLHLCAI